MSPKIFVRLSDKKLTATFSDKKECADLSLYIITLNNLQLENNKFNLKYILSIINSNLMSFYFISKWFIKNLNTWTPQIRLNEIRNIPIPNIPLSEQQPFIDKADLMLEMNKELHEKIDFVLRFLTQKYSIIKPSTKLQKFRSLDFAGFLKELKQVRISLSDQAELMDFFEVKKSEILVLKNEIDTTDREIDEMVFELYGLTEEEKRVVMES